MEQNWKWDMEQNWIRLPLDGANNVRELGGIPAMGGKPTAWHAFLRSDQLSKVTNKDREMLLAYGVRTVIDLRSESETVQCPDHAELLSAVQYHHIPFIEIDVSPQGQAETVERLRDLSSLYLSLLEQRDVIRLLFDRIAQAPRGCILFHCTAGKDRTGVLSMLLLMLAGVDRQDCVANYIQSYTNLTRNPAFLYLRENGYHSLICSDASDIETAYDSVASAPGGIQGFLHNCGVTDSCMEQVQKRLWIS